MFSWVKRRARLHATAQRSAGSAIESSGSATTMQRGVELVQAGRFPEAATLFAQVVDREPNSAAGLVNLAYALQRCDRQSEALDHLTRAAALDDASFDAHYMRGLALESVDLDAAADHLRKSIQLRQDFPRACIDLCRVLARGGKDEDGLVVINEALSKYPDDPDLLETLGDLRLSKADAQGALAAYELAFTARPGQVDHSINRVIALRTVGRLDEAVAALEAAIESGNVSSSIHAELGRSFQALGRFTEAQQAYQKALDLEPGNADILNQLGTALQARGDKKQAIECYRQAVAVAPDMPGPHANLGLAYFEEGHVAKAIDEYRTALAIRDIPEAHDNLAIALHKQGAIVEAIGHYERALELAPDNMNTRCNLAAALADGGQPHESSAVYRQIITLHPDHLVARSNLLFNLSVDPTVSPQEYLAEAACYDRIVSARRAPSVVSLQPRSGQRLRVGFVSGDFRIHPVGIFLEGVIAHLDRKRFEAHAYTTVVFEDALTNRLKASFCAWHVLTGLSDDVAAERIRSDGIDVLFDLAGHTGENRLPVFAMRAAPLQVTWLGYFASTGVSAMDFVLSDAVCTPSASDAHFSETVWRLPRTRLCYTPPPDAAATRVMPLPALLNGHITFGSYQRISKISEPVLALWSRVLVALPSARLRLQTHQTGRPFYVERLLRRLGEFGVERNRVLLKPPSAREPYLRSYEEVDIILDTFPFNGGTTTSEALWMGVPTLTIEGTTMISRQGEAMLRAVDLPEWIAADADEFVSKAVAHATDVPRLAAFRSTLRDRLRTSALFDTKQFAVDLAQAIEGMVVQSRSREDPT